MKINNLSKNLKDWIVVRYVEHEFWYWGTYESQEKAKEVAEEISGMIVNRKDITNA